VCHDGFSERIEGHIDDGTDQHAGDRHDKGQFAGLRVRRGGAVRHNILLPRTRLVSLLAEQKACLVATEACATSHDWGRVAQSHGQELRHVPAARVKPFVKRQTEDNAPAETIVEAASRPTLRSVAVKKAETQGRRAAVAVCIPPPGR
jgi:hypothetical protein